MSRYRHVGDQLRSFPELGLDLAPGQEFETDQVVNHPDLQLLDEEPDSPEPDSAKSAQASDEPDQASENDDEAELASKAKE